MRIAHINNTSGVASIIAEQQKTEGHDEVFVFNKIIYRQFGGKKFNYYSPISRYALSPHLQIYPNFLNIIYNIVFHDLLFCACRILHLPHRDDMVPCTNIHPSPDLRNIEFHHLILFQDLF